MNLITVFLTALGGTGVGLAIAAFFGKKWISHQLAKNLILYEKELDAKAEVLKNNLSIFAHEQTVGITRIDAQRAEAIKAVYSAITKWGLAVNEVNFPVREGILSEEEMLDFFKETKKKIKTYNEDLVRVMVDNAIFLSSQTYEQLAEAFKLMAIYSIQIGKIIDEFLDSDQGNRVKLISENLKNEKMQFDAAYDPIRGRLIDEFRRLMKAQ